MPRLKKWEEVSSITSCSKIYKLMYSKIKTSKYKNNNNPLVLRTSNSTKTYITNKIIIITMKI